MSKQAKFSRRQTILGLTSVGGVLYTGTYSSSVTADVSCRFKQAELIAKIREVYEDVGTNLGGAYLSAAARKKKPTEFDLLAELCELKAFDSTVLLQGSVQERRAMFDAMVYSDFEVGRVVVQSGFTLAKTEVLIAALLALGVRS